MTKISSSSSSSHPPSKALNSIQNLNFIFSSGNKNLVYKKKMKMKMKYKINNK